MATTDWKKLPNAALFVLRRYFAPKQKLSPAFPTVKELEDLPRWARKFVRRAKEGRLTPDDLVDFGVALYKHRARYERNPDLEEDEAKLLKDLSLWLRRRSEPALKRLLKNLRENYPVPVYTWYREHLLREHPLPEDADLAEFDPAEIETVLKQVVKKLTGRSALDIVDLEERRRAKERHPELYAEFLSLRRKVKRAFETELENYFRATQKERIPIEELQQHFKRLGLPFLFPKGLKDVLVDINGNLYTRDGQPIEGKPPYTARVEMGGPDAEYVFKATLPNGTVQYYYTKGFKSRRTKEKFTSILPYVEDPERFQALATKWRRYLKSRRPTLRTLATLVELLYRTQARIGAKVPKKERQGGYGLSTLRVKHVQLKTDPKTGETFLVLSYRGKKGVKQKHVVKSEDEAARRAIENVRELLAGKEPNDFVFTTETGKRVTAELVNKFLAKIGVPFTAHKFRHIIGTQLAKVLLGRRKRFKSEKDAVQYFKDALTKIGKILGHKTGEKVTWTTAKDNYVDPAVMLDFFRRHGFRVPKFLQKFKTEEEG